MSESTLGVERRAIRQVGAVIVGLALTSGTALGQVAVSRGQQRDPVAYVATPAWGVATGRQLPQDIRIMQRIVTTALEEVTPPELPAVLRDEGGVEGAAGGLTYAAVGGARAWSLRSRLVQFGGRDISGFYMQGYGYLFTVTWRVSSRFGNGTANLELRAAELGALANEARRAAGDPGDAESRAAGEASQTLQAERDRLEQQGEAWQQWSARYREKLAEQLRGVIAQYGSTLTRAQPDEAITFIADFGGGESESYTASARRGELSGAGREQNLQAVQLARGETQISDTLRTELKIMSAILDTAREEHQVEGVSLVYSAGGWSVGRDAGYRYVPGYGALFRRNARLNLATRVIQDVAAGQRNDVLVGTLRDQIDRSTEEQREAYSAHLDALRRSSAEVLATYGPTLTAMGADEWIGIYYEVGSAAELLEGGITDFLVQARIQEVRQAASQSEPVAWLVDRLVTNERQD